MMPPIRVLQIVTGLAIGDQDGGAELFGAQLARHLDEEEFQSAVFGLWEYGSAAEKEWTAILEAEGIQTELSVVPSNQVVSDSQNALRRLWAFLDDFNPHIINSHSEKTDAFNVLMSVLHPAHPRSVRTMHTDEQWQDSPLLGEVMLNVVFPLLSSAEVAISEAVRHRLDRRLLARLTRKRSILCYNGIEASILDEEAPADDASSLPEQMPPDRPRLGVIGRLSRQKGHSVLLRAMKLVIQAQPANLVVVGSGPLEEDLKEFASDLGIRDSLHFLGSRRDVLRILPHLDLVVSSSLWEGFPTVLLEAMAKEVPIIATDVSGSRELVRTGKTGILVPPRDPEALADAILQMLGEPSAARSMAKNARQLVSQFTIQNAASRYAQLYRRIVGETAQAQSLHG